MKNWRDAPPGNLNLLPSPSSSSIRLEQEVVWNPAQVYVDLQAACQVLSDRGWKLAAKWAAEQWMGLPAVEDGATAMLQPDIDDKLWPSSSSSGGGPMLSYAKTLLDLGEFAHAAAVLSQPHATVERMPPPLPDLSAVALGMRAYALYMAGEKRKEEAHQESSRYVVAWCCVIAAAVRCCFGRIGKIGMPALFG